MNLFGKKKQQPVVQPELASNNAVDTIKVLRENSDTLEKRESHITKKVEASLLEAKQKAVKKDRKGLFLH